MSQCVETRDRRHEAGESVACSGQARGHTGCVQCCWVDCTRLHCTFRLLQARLPASHPVAPLPGRGCDTIAVGQPFSALPCVADSRASGARQGEGSNMRAGRRLGFALAQLAGREVDARARMTSGMRARLSSSGRRGVESRAQLQRNGRGDRADCVDAGAGVAGVRSGW